MIGPQRVSFIINPAAGRLPRRSKLDAAIRAACDEHHLTPHIVETEAPGHATTLAHDLEATGDCDTIIVCGGDGTLNELINGLDTNRIRVGQVRGGTANVWAKEAGIPRDPLRALRAQFTAPAIPLDVGRAGDRRFLLMAGYGLDAAAVAAVRPRLKRRLGGLAYVIAGIQAGLRDNGFRVALQFDDDPAIEIHAGLLIIGNTRLYGGLAQLTPNASAVDGLLDCVAFLGHGPLATLRIAPSVFLRRHLRSRRVLYRRARHIQITPIGGQPMPHTQVDGDLELTRPGTLRVEPAALSMLVPRAHRPVFRK
jgi:YegS/Rv2252/BmrU family lipid kinase